MNRTLEDASKRKLEISRMISDLILEYTKDYGVDVTHIDLVTYAYTGEGRRVQSVQLEVQVR